MANFSEMIAKRPGDADLLRRIEEFVNGSADTKHTLNRLFDAMDPSSMRYMIELLDELVEEGLLQRIFRIESEAGGGIGDFSTIDAIPRTIFDMRMGREVEVRPERIQVFYQALEH